MCKLNDKAHGMNWTSSVIIRAPENKMLSQRIYGINIIE